MVKGIVIVWPSHNDFITTIINELKSNNITIVENNKLSVNKIFIKNILLEIHYGKKWWNENIETEYLKRINNDNEQLLQYLIIEKNDLFLHVKSVKKNIRTKYNLDKSYFHMSDPDCFEHLGLNCNCKCNENNFIIETEKHINLLKNKNSIHFLNNAKYNAKLNFYKFFEYYKMVITKQNNINMDSFCIDNGGILAAYNVRDTHDLDFLNTYNDNISFNNKYIGCENKNHRKEYELLGYTIEDIINNKENHFYHFGMKFMSLEILKKFKFNRTHTIGTGHNKIRQKDINDYNLIKELI